MFARREYTSNHKGRGDENGESFTSSSLPRPQSLSPTLPYFPLPPSFLTHNPFPFSPAQPTPARSRFCLKCSSYSVFLAWPTPSCRLPSMIRQLSVNFPTRTATLLAELGNRYSCGGSASFPSLLPSRLPSFADLNSLPGCSALSHRLGRNVVLLVLRRRPRSLRHPRLDLFFRHASGRSTLGPQKGTFTMAVCFFLCGRKKWS